jgi:hypothetical protein
VSSRAVKRLGTSRNFSDFDYMGVRYPLLNPKSQRDNSHFLSQHKNHAPID